MAWFPRCRLALAAIPIAFGSAARADEPSLLNSRPGVSESVEFIAAAAPVATVVLFPGGNGSVGAVKANFLLRVRRDIAAAGLNVVVVDVPSDHSSGVDPSFRAGAESGQDIAAVVAFAKGKADLPVWLVGTSNGSISAANGAVRLGPSRVAGVVLTSSVWSGGMSFVPYNQIAVPVLVVHNHDDRCPSANFAGAELAMTQLASAPAKELLAVSGGVSKSDRCEALAPHGYYGIEDKVVPPMVRWIVEHSPKNVAH